MTMAARDPGSGNFGFLADEWPAVYDAATKAESAIHSDPRTACFYARRALELAVSWAYKSDEALRLPYQDNLSALIHEPTFKRVVGDAVFTKARVINGLGNQAVHSHRATREDDARAAVRELFHVAYWLARTYGRGERPSPSLQFDLAAVPETVSVSKQTIDQLQTLETSLHERDERLASVLADKAALDDELKRLRAEVARAKKAAAARPDDHDYSEAETRDYFIDLLLREAGWPLDQVRDREFEVAGMPNESGQGFVDYVLWGDDGKPLALVEAKRTRKSAMIGQQQAKLYADCLEEAFGRRPIIFYTNGYEHWLWDDLNYPPRSIQGFLKKDELELLIQRRTTRKRLADAAINDLIVERYYQTRAIRRITESFERDHERKALLVMATGAGKTRTVIALADLLMRCNWVKRVLFLADRVALVNQTVGAFKQHLPESSPVNLVTERDGDGRVFVSTYPTMMGLIDEAKDGQRRFGVGHFDLIVIDEAHRSVYQKYRAIFDYFDSFLVGLTATPKDEVDINTYALFDLERGVPTDAYSLEDAIKDEFLVPPRGVSVPVKFQRSGIKYDELSEEEKEQWDALEWDDEGDIPDRVEAQAINKWLFNEDTVDKVLEHLMTHGQTVAGGDQIGKTIIFAKNQAHAEFIAQRFDVNYPQYKGSYARVVHNAVPYVQSVIDDFASPSKPPHIAISVDMLDTGIDIPEIVNLVFFKLVRSKTKFWQMIGRGTRLRPDLFGPGDDKKFFYVFDYCENLEFFSQDLPTSEGSLTESLRSRLFKARLAVIHQLDQDSAKADEAASLRKDLAELLRAEVAAMNVDNFVVRPNRRLVEKFADRQSWSTLSTESLTELAEHVAGLPSAVESDDEEAKRFDLLVLNLQLALLRGEPGFVNLRDRVRELAALLEEKANIPMVHAQLDPILDVQTEEWWEDVTPQMLESLRKRLRGLIKLIDRQRRKPIYSDFSDALGTGTEVELPGFGPADGYERFRAKARAFLREHRDDLVIHKLRTNHPLALADLDYLEHLLVSGGIGQSDDVERAREESQGLGLFVRSLVGLDREAAKQAFASFLKDRNLSANQIEFIDMIINHLAEHGVMPASLLYESPFTDITPHGPDGLFPSELVDELMTVLDTVRATAVAA